MRIALALAVFLCSAASAYAAEPQKWCSKDGRVIVQTGDDKQTFLLDGKPVDVGFEHGAESDDVVVLVYDGEFFASCK